MGIYNLFLPGLVLQLKTPKNSPIFSERSGIKTPLVKFKGYRFFIFKRKGGGAK